MFKEKIIKIQKDLTQRSQGNREEVFQALVSNRLTESLNSYYKTLIDSYNYLSSKNELKILRGYTKGDKNDETIR